MNKTSSKQDGFGMPACVIFHLIHVKPVVSGLNTTDWHLGQMDLGSAVARLIKASAQGQSWTPTGALIKTMVLPGRLQPLKTDPFFTLIGKLICKKKGQDISKQLCWVKVMLPGTHLQIILSNLSKTVMSPNCTPL